MIMDPLALFALVLFHLVALVFFVHFVRSKVVPVQLLSVISVAVTTGLLLMSCAAASAQHDQSASDATLTILCGTAVILVFRILDTRW